MATSVVRTSQSCGMDVDSYVGGSRHREYASNFYGKPRGSGGSSNFDAALCERFTTGSEELDALFGGGVERGRVTEITADDYERDHVLDLILNICVTATVRSHRSLRRQGRSVSKIYFLDTQGYFRMEVMGNMVEKIVQRLDLDPSWTPVILANMVMRRAWGDIAMAHACEELETVISKDGPFSIIVIDTIDSLIVESDVAGREHETKQQSVGSARHMLSAHTLDRLSDMAAAFNVAIVATSKVWMPQDQATRSLHASYRVHPYGPYPAATVGYNQTYSTVSDTGEGKHTYFIEEGGSVKTLSASRMGTHIYFGDAVEGGDSGEAEAIIVDNGSDAEMAGEEEDAKEEGYRWGAIDPGTSYTKGMTLRHGNERRLKRTWRRGQACDYDGEGEEDSHSEEKEEDRVPRKRFQALSFRRELVDDDDDYDDDDEEEEEEEEEEEPVAKKRGRAVSRGTRDTTLEEYGERMKKRIRDLYFGTENQDEDEERQEDEDEGEDEDETGSSLLDFPLYRRDLSQVGHLSSPADDSSPTPSSKEKASGSDLWEHFEPLIKDSSSSLSSALHNGPPSSMPDLVNDDDDNDNDDDDDDDNDNDNGNDVSQSLDDGAKVASDGDDSVDRSVESRPPSSMPSLIVDDSVSVSQSATSLHRSSSMPSLIADDTHDESSLHSSMPSLFDPARA